MVAMITTGSRRNLTLATLAVATVLTVAGCSADTATSGSSASGSPNSSPSTAGTPTATTQPGSGAPSTAPSGTRSSALSASPAAAGTAASSPGSYIDYADYESDPGKYAGNEVVLFFNASWCPTCQQATSNLESSTIPNGLTVVSVDYDEATELKQKYGVTVQHTFVQVSPDGSELAKWSGSTTASEIESKVV